MRSTDPYRNRVQTSGRFDTQRKKSGDQHILPEDEPAEEPHRPQRISRADMEKLPPADPDPDDPVSP